MSQERDPYQELLSKYPKIFKDNYGLCFGRGWLIALDQTCGLIQGYIDTNNKPQVTIDYIKEKYGLMDVFAKNTDDYLDEIICNLEDSTETICEVCGNPGTINDPPQWLKVRCDDHKNI